MSNRFLSDEKPDCIINAAARVGGIHANSTYPAEFIHQNLILNANLIHSAWKNGVSRFLNLGSSCIYPCKSQQPIKEEYLLTGPLEKTNEAYALAKIAGLEMCRHYRSSIWGAFSQCHANQLVRTWGQLSSPGFSCVTRINSQVS
jgi:GDP-L-fucose synthase